MPENHNHFSIYEQEKLTEITGLTLRPGGLKLTEEAVNLCNFLSGANIVDVGCGTGVTVSFLIKKYGFNVLGIDLSQEMIKEGKRESPGLPLFQGNGLNLPFSSGTMDGLFMECSFSLIKDIDQVLSESNRVLKSNGKLIVSDIYFKNINTKNKSFLKCSSFLSTACKEFILDKLAEHDFALKLWLDKSEYIIQLVFDSIMKFGSVDTLWNCLLPETEKENIILQQIKDWKPGYFLLIASK